MQISDILSGFDVVQFYKTSPDECCHALLFIGHLAASSANPVIINKVWDQYHQLAEYLATISATGRKTDSPCHQVALSLADASVRLSGSKDGRTAGLLMFVNKLTDLVKTWPMFAKCYGLSFIQALNRVPAGELPSISLLNCLVRAQL
jgi:hypothetical protein